MKAAKKAGIDSFALCFENAPAVIDYYEKAGFETRYFPPPAPSFRHAVKFWYASRGLAAELKRMGASAVHCADILAAYHGGVAARLAGLPLISHVRNRYDTLPFRERFFLRAVHKWVPVSKNTQDRFCMALTGANSVVLYDGIPMPDSGADETAAVRAEFGIAGNAVIAGMFARVAPQKDYETLAKASALLAGAYPDLRFLIVGDDDSTEFVRAHKVKAEAWLKERGVEDRFIFTGFRRDVARLMRACDLFVLSTHWEGLPLVLLEAMSHARPVVATAVDGIPELVSDGETGLLTPHGDAAALAAALQRLADDPALAARLGQAGRRMVETKFSQEEFERQVERLYRGLLGQG